MYIYTIKKVTSLVSLISAILILSGCAAMFLPENQKVIVKSNNANNEIYLDNELIGKGKSFSTKINKQDAQGQIVISRKGYKNINDVILKSRRQIAFYPLLILDLPFGYLGFGVDLISPNCQAYPKEITINASEEYLLPVRKESDKYLNISNIKLDINDKEKDLVDIQVGMVFDMNNLQKSIQDSEKAYYENLKKKTAKEEKKKIKNNKKDVKKLVSDEDKNQIKTDDTEYSYELYKTLKETKFIDTVNKIFNDQNNTIVLEASIKKITNYNISTKWDRFYKAKLDLTWYLKNTYDEIIDSIVTTELSGNFMSIYDYNNTDNKYSGFAKMVGDAVSNSYIKLHKNKSFVQQLKINKDLKLKDENLLISTISGSDRVTNKIDAFKATAIVKTKENGKDAGHGSGFAISKNGYLITNYHVIAGSISNKQKEVIVVTSTGKEIPAKIVRFNKYRDVALLKVDYTFDKAFHLDTKDKAEIMMDVYTIGAPKSIELGQSVSVGIVSSIRDVNENKYLQLGMSINGGNSGGPIFDSQGQLHGIVVSKLVGYSTEGVGFAIPSYLVSDYLNLTVK